MSDQMDNLLQEIGALNATVKEHLAAGDKATLDDETLKAAVKDITDEMALVRRGEQKESGDLVGPPGFRVPAGKRIASGKFAGAKASEVAFIASLLRRGHDFYPTTIALPSDDLVKALTSTGSLTGDELVPTAMAAELWQDFFTASQVVSNLGHTPMPTDPFDMSLGLGDVTWRKGTQNTVTTVSDTATAKSTMTTTEQVCEVNWSYTLDEDSVVAMLPALRERLQISGGEAMDDFCLNADSTNAGTGNINEDDADPDDTDYFLSDGQDGIRHQWLVDNTSQTVDAGGDALTDADILAALKLMGKYAVNPTRAAIFCDISTYIKGFLDLDSVQTVDKYGPKAVVVTGELGKYRGIPIVPSASAPLTEADGKCSTTSGQNTLGQLSIVHRDFWRVGFRRELLIEVDKDIQKRSLLMVVSFRIAIAAHGARASNTHTSGVMNILVT